MVKYNRYDVSHLEKISILLQEELLSPALTVILRLPFAFLVLGLYFSIFLFLVLHLCFCSDPVIVAP